MQLVGTTALQGVGYGCGGVTLGDLRQQCLGSDNGLTIRSRMFERMGEPFHGGQGVTGSGRQQRQPDQRIDHHEIEMAFLRLGQGGSQRAAGFVCVIESGCD